MFKNPLKFLSNLQDSFKIPVKSSRFVPKLIEYLKETLRFRSVLKGRLRNSFKILKDFTGLGD